MFTTESLKTLQPSSGGDAGNFLGHRHRKLFGALNDLIKFYLRHWQLENLISSQNTKLTNDKMLRSRKYQNNVCHVTVEWIRREAKKINKAKSDEKLLLAF